MVPFPLFRHLALGFDEVVELPHFENTSFRIKKKIFATLNERENRAVVKLSEIDQSAICSFDRNIVYPVPNKWGKVGWTILQLEHVDEETLKDALTMAYCHVAPSKLALKYKN